MEENRKLPRNIRQIGERDSLYRIYIEDYVDTFLHKLEGEGTTKAGFLLGETVTLEEEKCWFINGAVVVDDLCGKEEAKFDDKIWSQAQEDMDAYFPGMKICGWFLKEPDGEDMDFLILQQIHREAFPEGETIFLLCQGNELKMWAGSDGELSETSGFYIYYERNKQMQEYMINRNEGNRVDAAIEDKTTRNFRSIMVEKKEEAGQKHNVAMYRICAGLAMVVLVLGINNYISYREMNELATQTQSMEGQVEEVNATVINEALSQEQNDSAQGSHGATDSYREMNELATQTQSMEGQVEEVNATVINEALSQEQNDSAQGSHGATDSSVEIQDEEKETESTNITEESKENESQYQWREMETQVNAGIHYYEVKPGDTLIYISVSIYGTTDMVSKICELNEIDDPNAIAIGQKIQLP